MPPLIPTAPGGNGNLDVAHLTRGLKRRVARGAAFTFISQTIKLLVSVGGGAILARLLTPLDYGLLGMVSVLTGILTLLGNIGLSSAVVQEPEITHTQMSTLFWLNVALGLCFTIVTAILAPVLAWFYGDARLTSVTLVLSVGFVISGIGAQHNALLRRQMRFGVLSIMDAVSGILALFIGVVLACLHCGYWSLVAMLLTGTLATCVGGWITCSWRPGRYGPLGDVHSLIKFGGNVTAFNIFNYAIRNGDNVLLGWRWGADILGQYTKAYNLLLFPLVQLNTPITHVAVPALSRLREEPYRYRRHYLQALTVITYISIPLVIGLGIFSQELVVLLLGTQWLEAARIFKLLAIAAVLQPMANTTGWLFTSLNRSAEMAKWGYVAAPCYLVAFCIGLPWGAYGVALAYSVTTWVMHYPCFVVATKGTPVSMVDIWYAIYRPICVGSALGVSWWMCHHAVVWFGWVWSLAMSIVIGALVVALIRSCSSAVKADLDVIADIVRSVRVHDRHTQ